MIQAVMDADLRARMALAALVVFIIVDQALLHLLIDSHHGAPVVAAAIGAQASGLLHAAVLLLRPSVGLIDNENDTFGRAQELCHNATIVQRQLARGQLLAHGVRKVTLDSDTRDALLQLV